MFLYVAVLYALVALSYERFVWEFAKEEMSGIQTKSSIIGGYQAAAGDFPYQVSLRRWKNEHFCGGSIIDDVWILTAAHCIYGKNPKNVTVVMGTNLLNSDGHSYAVQELITHEGYIPETITNDIGLVRLKKAMNLNADVGKIELYTDDVPDGVNLTLSGWGMTSYPEGSFPNHLQTIRLLSISNEECVKSYPTTDVTKSHICTLTKVGEGACYGDSGSPLVAYYRKQVGVASAVVPCAKGKPDIFIRVNSYLSWIDAHTKSKGTLINKKNK